MSNLALKEPIELLADIESRSKKYAAGLPQQTEVKQTWSGVGFKLGDTQFVAPLHEVTEILPFPPMSRIPGSKEWVIGIANIRGSLLPVLDLQCYLSNKATAITHRSRVLAINHNEIYSGLLVDEVMGLKHFYEEEHSSRMPKVDDAIKIYLKGTFTQNDVDWSVFSMVTLADKPEFLQAGV